MELDRGRVAGVHVDTERVSPLLSRRQHVVFTADTRSGSALISASRWAAYIRSCSASWGAW